MEKYTTTAKNISSFNEKMFLSSVHPFWLIFIDNKIMCAYNKNLLQLRIKQFYLLNIVYFVIEGFSMYTTISNYQTIIYAIAMSILMFVQLILIMAVKYKPQIIINIYIAIILAVNIILCVEYAYFDLVDRETEQTNHRQKYFHFGIVYFFQNFLVAHLIRKWYFKSFFYQTVFEYYIFRLFGIQGFSYITVHLVSFVVFPILFYYNEKFEKRNFFELYSQQEQLKETQCMMVKNISSSIFISQVENKKVQLTFANQNFIDQFNIKDTNQIKEVTELIQVQLSQSSQHQQSLYQYISDLQIQNIILSQCDKSSGGSEIQIECHYTSPQQPKNIRYYYTKIIDCIWDSKDSKMVILDNISEKVLNRHLQKIDKYKDVLLASVTHDLKNPLNCIMLFSQHALKSTSMTEINDYLKVILKNAQLQSCLIQDILDFSQYKNNKLKLNISEFSIQEVFQEIIEMFEDQLKQKNISIKSSFIKPLNITQNNDTVNSDKNRIKQILINLVSNAYKYTLSGTINIETKESIYEGNNVLRISVTDTGVGIPQEIQSHLFKKYSTFNHTSANLNKQGVGLGLRICKKLVKILGPSSQIDLQSEVNKGSKFTFFIYKNINQIVEKVQRQGNKQKTYINIPIQSETNIFSSMEAQESIQNNTNHIVNLYQRNINIQTMQMHSKYAVKRHSSIKVMETKNILIVDDNIFNIMAIKIQLSKFSSLNISTASNGQEALDIFNNLRKTQNCIQIIITDIEMPIMNGYELIKNIRLLEEQSSNKFPCQLFILSGDSEIDKQFLSRYQIMCCISKPIQQDKLELILKESNII